MSFTTKPTLTFAVSRATKSKRCIVYGLTPFASKTAFIFSFGKHPIRAIVVDWKIAVSVSASLREAADRNASYSAVNS
jgi:hypothetical protein